MTSKIMLAMLSMATESCQTTEVLVNESLLLPLDASSWLHLRISGPHPLNAELWELTPRRLSLITLLGSLSAAVSPWLIQGLPWTKGRKVRAVMGHPGNSPWDHL